MHRFPTSFISLILALSALLGSAAVSRAQTTTPTQTVHPIVYKLDFEKTGSSINFNFFKDGYVIGPYEGSALVGLGNFIFTSSRDGVKEYVLVESSAHMFFARKGSTERMVFGGGDIGLASFSGYLGIGRVNTSLSVPGAKLKVAKSMKGAALAGADETFLVGTVDEPTDGTLSLAGNLNVKASLSSGFTRQANDVEGEGSIDDATQIVIDYLESFGYIRGDENFVSIAGTQDGDRINDIDGAFTVSLSRESATASTFSYDVAGTATAGTDYTALSGTVTVPAGDTSATITVPVITSTTAGEATTLIVTLTGVTSGDDLLTINSSGDTASIDITNGSLAGIRATQPVASRADSNGEFTVFLSQVSPTITEISYSVTITGSLVEGTDFTPLTRTVLVAAASGSNVIPISLSRDTGATGTGTVSITLDAVTAGNNVVIDSTNQTATVEVTD